MAVVNDYSLLECRFRDVSGIMAMDLKISGQWTLTDGTVLDQISAGSSITEVTSRFQPESGYEQRMRFQVDGTWSSWTSWTTGRISQDVDVPAAGQEETVYFDAEMRPTTSGGTVAMSGYIKTKKLNSGE